MNIFTYGTLMVPAVMAAVTGRRLPSTPAILNGYGRFCLIGEVYPGMIEMPGAKTAGVVYSNANERTLSVLDAFEGDYYQRTQVSVSTDALSDGSSVQEAYTYVIRPEYRHLLSDRPWRLDVFRDRHLEAFMRQYTGFSAIRASSRDC